ncbi:hypothetical protein C8J57DRAFT_698792 [Mycena rebaudengoi]|nr:hypothetical protein C8J57DRAFT_698792 [Mycena rebaudengoi]
MSILRFPGRFVRSSDVRCVAETVEVGGVRIRFHRQGLLRKVLLDRFLLSIAYSRRTLRSKDPSISPHPPNMGTFELYSTADINSPVTDGDLVIGMWNCEAMWISFQRIREPCAVKISSAGHNLLPLHLDYLVVDDNDQCWLDVGWDSNFNPQQIVAVSHDKPIEIEVYRSSSSPSASVVGYLRPEDFEEYGEDPDGFELDCDNDFPVDIESSPSIVANDMDWKHDVLCGSEFQMGINRPRVHLYSGSDGVATKIGDSLVLEAKLFDPPFLLSVHLVETGEMLKVRCHSDDSVRTLKHEIRYTRHLDSSLKLTYLNMKMEDTNLLSDFRLSSKTIVQCNLHGAHTPPPNYRPWFPHDLRISDMVEPSRFDCHDQAPLSDVYDPIRPHRLTLALLNTSQFHSVTGFPCPTSPITADTYRDLGFPWLEEYEEPAVLPFRSESAFDSSTANSSPPTTIINCEYCEYGRAATILHPCCHSICEDCDAGDECPTCSGMVQDKQVIVPRVEVE